MRSRQIEDKEIIKQFDTEVFVQSLTLSARAKVLGRAGENSEFLPALLEVCVCDSEGKRLKTYDEWEEFGDTSEKFTAALKLFGECREIAGLDQEEVEKKPRMQ